MFKYRVSRKAIQCSRAVSCGRTDKTKLGVAFTNVSNAPLSSVVPEGIRVTGVIAPLILNSALGILSPEKARTIATDPEQSWPFCSGDSLPAYSPVASPLGRKWY